MSREIKFRAWVNGEMITDMYPQSFNPTESLNDTLNDPTVILMQYTGLQDKNEKEIYEGDIVEFEVGDGKMISDPVEFHGGAFYPICEQEAYTYKVIGNIHEDE